VPATSGTPAKDEPDEVTVVRTRAEELRTPTPRHSPVTVPIYTPPPSAPPPATATFNPLKIIIPSAIALLVVFAGIYAWTRTSPPATENQNTNQQNQLAADPNSQPVQPGASPTGKGEEGIPAGGAINRPANVNANANASPNANADDATAPVPEVSPEANVNANSNANANTNRKAPPLPEPTRSVAPPENVPPPSPVATKTPAEKPSPAATATPPPPR
jgi:hypothetical protein